MFTPRIIIPRWYGSGTGNFRGSIFFKKKNLLKRSSGSEQREKNVEVIQINNLFCIIFITCLMWNVMRFFKSSLEFYNRLVRADNAMVKIKLISSPFLVLQLRNTEIALIILILYYRSSVMRNSRGSALSWSRTFDRLDFGPNIDVYNIKQRFVRRILAKSERHFLWKFKRINVNTTLTDGCRPYHSYASRDFRLTVQLKPNTATASTQNLTSRSSCQKKKKKKADTSSLGRDKVKGWPLPSHRNSCF